MTLSHTKVKTTKRKYDVLENYSDWLNKKKNGDEAMRATKVTENRDAFTIEEAVNFAIDAAQEAYDALKGKEEYDRHKAAAEAYRACMPLLETKQSVKAFIACVARGVDYSFIKGNEARLMLYGAQVWLQVEASKQAEVLQ